MTEFRVGDKVNWMGLEGEVDFANEVEVLVRFNNGSKVSFSPDGRYRIDHTEPSLKLIERKKEPVVRWLWVFKGEPNGWLFNTIFYSEEEAEKYFKVKISVDEYKKLEWSRTEFTD